MRSCPSSRWTLAGRSPASARHLPLLSLRIRTEPELMAIPALLQPGQRYRVYHHRDRPDLSMLSAGFHLRSAFPLGLAMQMMLLGGELVTELGLDANPGDWLRILFGFNSALILLILLIGSDRFASRITRIPS